MSLSDLIKNDLARNNLAHANLLIGNDKAEFEKVVAIIIEELKCDRGDIVFLKANETAGKKGEIGTDEARDFIRQLSLKPFGPCRLGVVYDVEKLNAHSANTLLKTLEEPPADTIIFLLSATEAVLPTITSRCRIYKGKNIFSVAPSTFEIAEIGRQSLKEVFSNVDRIVKEESAGAFIEEIEFFLREKMKSTYKEAFANLILECEETKKRIKNNANSKLALEVLCLNLRLELKKEI